MRAIDVIKNSLASTQQMVGMFLADLSDQDILVRSVPAANAIAWQLGHLIASEQAILAGNLPGAEYPPLPESLKAQSSGKSSGVVPPGGYLRKADYLEWFNKVRAATLANVDRISEADLDRPVSGEIAAFAPTLGAALILVANHTMMHAGQFTVVRRALNKPVLF